MNIIEFIGSENVNIKKQQEKNKHDTVLFHIMNILSTSNLDKTNNLDKNLIKIIDTKIDTKINTKIDNNDLFIKHSKNVNDDNHFDLDMVNIKYNIKYNEFFNKNPSIENDFVNISIPESILTDPKYYDFVEKQTYLNKKMINEIYKFMIILKNNILI